jgi:membrane protein implicated in regulation of membrane protease activity
MNDVIATLEQWMWLVWLIILVLSLVIEAATAALVSVWFAAGALVCLGLSFIPGLPYWGEIIIFLGVSLGTFLAIRPYISKIMKKRTIRSNVDSLVGEKGIVVTPVDSLHWGAVRLKGVIWTAVPVKEGDTFDEGETVRIKAIDGNKLMIEHLEVK